MFCPRMPCCSIYISQRPIIRTQPDSSGIVEHFVGKGPMQRQSSASHKLDTMFGSPCWPGCSLSWRVPLTHFNHERVPLSCILLCRAKFSSLHKCALDGVSDLHGLVRIASWKLMDRLAEGCSSQELSRQVCLHTIDTTLCDNNYTKGCWDSLLQEKLSVALADEHFAIRALACSTAGYLSAHLVIGTRLFGQYSVLTWIHHIAWPIRTTVDEGVTPHGRCTSRSPCLW
jgi:hypothetical protein